MIKLRLFVFQIMADYRLLSVARKKSNRLQLMTITHHDLPMSIKDRKIWDIPQHTSSQLSLTGGGSVIIWSCISHYCKLDCVTIPGNLTGEQYMRCLTASCCSPFRQPLTSCNIWIYGYQHQAASFKGSNSLPSK